MERESVRTEIVQHSANIGRMSPPVIFVLWFGYLCYGVAITPTIAVGELLPAFAAAGGGTAGFIYKF